MTTSQRSARPFTQPVEAVRYVGPVDLDAVRESMTTAIAPSVGTRIAYRSWLADMIWYALTHIRLGGR
ncbi:MAG: hypothetical protein WBA46_19485 [Thermomicrobiales bacterium]